MKGANNKATVTKEIIRILQALKIIIGINVDMIAQGSATSDNGNTTRRFYNKIHQLSLITGVDERLIQSFGTSHSQALQKQYQYWQIQSLSSRYSWIVLYTCITPQTPDTWQASDWMCLHSGWPSSLHRRFDEFFSCELRSTKCKT